MARPDARLVAMGAGAVIIVVLVVALVRSCFAAGTVTVGGAMGMPVGNLYRARGNATSFAASLTIPRRVAPRDPDRPSVTGGGVNLRGLSTTDGFRRLTEVTREIAADGHSVGYVLYDVETGLTISHNANVTYYGASSIKGPYVVSVVEYELGDTAQATEASRIESIITNSDNTSYFNFRSAYGDGCFEQLVSATGSSLATSGASSGATTAIERDDDTGSIADDTYEFFTPGELLALWQQCYAFLASDEPGAAWLGSVLETPINSAIRYTAQGIGTTWSKPGWYPGEDSDYGTTVDGGVVRTDTGDVILAVMTDSPEDFQSLEEVVSALLSCRTEALSAS